MQQLIKHSPVIIPLASLVVFFGILCAQKAESPGTEGNDVDCKEYAGRTVSTNPILFAGQGDKKGKQLDLLAFAKARACLSSHEVQKISNVIRIKVKLYGYSHSNAEVSHEGYISSEDAGFPDLKLEPDLALFSGRWAWRDNARDNSVVLFFDKEKGKGIQVLENVHCKQDKSRVKCEDYKPGNSAFFGGSLKHQGKLTEFTPVEYFGGNNNYRSTGVTLEGQPIKVWRCGVKTLCAPYPMRKESDRLF